MEWLWNKYGDCKQNIRSIGSVWFSKFSRPLTFQIRCERTFRIRKLGWRFSSQSRSNFSFNLTNKTQLVDVFLEERFPTVIVLNKIDHPDADANIQKICQLYGTVSHVMVQVFYYRFWFIESIGFNICSCWDISSKIKERRTNQIYGRIRICWYFWRLGKA